MAETKITPLQAKRAQLDVIEKLLEALDDVKKNTKCDFKVVGKKDEQARNWRTGELLWEDDEKTVPKYEDKYDYVPIPEDELSEERKAKLGVIHDIKKIINSLI